LARGESANRGPPKTEISRTLFLPKGGGDSRVPCCAGGKVTHYRAKGQASKKRKGLPHCFPLRGKGPIFPAKGEDLSKRGVFQGRPLPKGKKKRRGSAAGPVGEDGRAREVPEGKKKERGFQALTEERGIVRVYMRQGQAAKKEVSSTARKENTAEIAIFSGENAAENGKERRLSLPDRYRGEVVEGRKRAWCISIARKRVEKGTILPAYERDHMRRGTQGLTLVQRNGEAGSERAEKAIEKGDCA